MCEHVQKITEALYRITDVFPDREPLKWYLRKEGLLIFRIFLKIEDSTIYERIKYIDKIERIIPHMISALELSSFGTFISRTNFEVLSREYNILLDFVKDKRDELVPDSIKQLSVRPIEERMNDGNNKDDFKKEDNHSFSSRKFEEKNKKDPLLAEKRGENIMRQHFFQNVNKTHQDFRASNGFDPVSDIREEKDHFSSGFLDRKEKIISIIKERGEVSVSDVAFHFGGISEKTIQRDLVSLTDSGTIRKYGDKRWRRYVLNAE